MWAELLNQMDNSELFRSGNGMLAALGVAFLWLLVYWGYKLGKRAEKRNAKNNTGNKLNAISKVIENRRVEPKFKLLAIYKISKDKK